MTYIRPSNVTYTEMAIWVDENAYKESCDDTKLYEYLYHLSNMLAHQYAYFSSSSDYDQFSLFSASRLFLRLHNSKQFIYEDDVPKMKHIKSILNYIKKVIYPYKVDFELTFNVVDKHIDTIQIGSFDVGSYVAENSNLFDSIDFSTALGSVDTIIRAHLNRIPKKKHSSEWENIYLSCMLTFIDSCVVSQEQLLKYKDSIKTREALLDRIYRDLSSIPPILYHLSPSMTTYVKVLVNELRHVLAAELSWKTSTHVHASDNMKSLLYTSLLKESST